ncbi:MAG: hypothetical protein WCI03_10770 [bacterium]
MTSSTPDNRDRGGYILVTVMIFTACAALLVFGLMNQSISWMKIAANKEALEEALYVADGGCQLSLAYIMAGNPIPATISGSIGEGTYTARITLMSGSSIMNYTLCSTGVVRGVRRVVTMDYVHSRSWAEFAMWYNQSGTINFTTGDRFKGKVHCNSPIYISSGGAPIFEQLLTSASPTWGSGPASAVFSNGFQLGVQAQTMSAINFTNTVSTQDCLRLQASLVLTGATRVGMSGTNFYITNSKRNWTNYNYSVVNPSIMTDGVMYVVSSGTSTGDLTIAGTLDGRMTLVAEGNINITNHLRYTINPTNAPSNDALGLISRKDIIVKTNCPSNLDIYAHLIAEGGLTSSTNDGIFTVENYTTRPASGKLNIYGGLVQNYRGAVGQLSGTTVVNGYAKNYVFDTRFATNPPPHYPVVGDKYYWGGWRDSP